MKYFFFLVLVFSKGLASFSQTTFSSLESFVQYANTKSITLQTNDIKVLQAKQGKLAAILSIPDVSGNINTNFTNNTRLPVNLFPAEAFGGAPGSYKEIASGVQYNTGFSQYIDIKLVNMEAWKNIKLAKINTAISTIDNIINKKTLQENIATLYYSIIQLQAQEKITQQYIYNADTVLQTITNKYKEGIAKQQEVNDGKINVLTQEENKRQIVFLIKQNYLSIKILCDIPENENILFTETIVKEKDINIVHAESNTLHTQLVKAREDYALASYKKTTAAFLPTLSFIGSNGYNQYNQDFTVFGGKWINSNYVGLKLIINIPNSVMVSNKVNAKYNYQLAQQATKQAQIKVQLEQKQLDNDWEKASSQYSNNKEIVTIQTDTYLKNKNLYNEGILSIDKTITSFNSLVNAEYNLITSKVNVLLATAKIDINNKFKN
jgi:outer membrane protein TolC